MNTVRSAGVTGHENAWNRSLAVAVFVVLCLCGNAEAAETFSAECFYNFPIQSVSAPVLDSVDHPHVAYSADSRLYYAYRSGGSWAAEWAGLEPVLDDPIAIALDASDSPRIAFTRSGQVMYGYRLAGGGWFNETVFSSLGHAEEIATSPSGAAHILYVREGIDAGLLHARRTGSNWSTTLVDSGGYDASLDFDGLGRPAVSYMVKRGSAVILRHAVLSGTWGITPVDTTPAAMQPSGTALHFDGDGKAHIAWGGGAGPGMSLLHHIVDGGAVTKETVETGGGSVNGRDPSIHVAPDGTVRITYYRDSTAGRGVRYAVKSAGAWSFSYVDSGFVSTLGGGIAVDGAGTPHVVFERGGGVGAFHAVPGAPAAPPSLPDALIETVAGGAGDAGTASSMVLDGSGVPHVLFFDETLSRLFYGTRTVEGWISQALAATWISNGETTSLALDAAGDPHILFNRNGTLYLGEREAGVWSRTVVDVNVHGASGDLALDSQGNDVILYNKTTSGSLYHAKRVAGVFTRTRVDSVVSGVGQSAFPSLAIGGADVMHASFVRWDDAAPDVVHTSGATAAALSSGMRIVDAAGANLSEPTSIALDSSGQPQIAYHGLDGRPRHAIQSGAFWRPSLIEAASGETEFVSLAVTSQGLPVVAYRKTTGGGAGLRLGILESFDGIWSTRPIDCALGAGSFAAIALDVDDKFHVTYYDENLGDLRYATDAAATAPPPVFAFDLTTEIVAGDPTDAGAAADMTLDAGGAPRVVYASQSSSSYVYGKKSGGAWTLETTPAPDPAGEGNVSIALDASGQPHILYYEPGGEQIRVARRSATFWQVSSPIAFNADPLSGDLAIDSSGKDVIVFSDAFDGSVYLAQGTANNFTTELIEANSVPGPTFPSIAIGASNTRHVSFLRRGAAGVDLYYAAGMQPAISAEFVAPAGGGDGAWTSIAVDANGVPQIAYQRRDGKLGHAIRIAPGAWQLSIADPIAGQTRCASLALDAAGLPRVSYVAAPCAGAAGVKIAKRAAIGGQWATAHADTSAGPGSATALAIDANDKIHVAYMHAVAVDLRYGIENDATFVADGAVLAPPPAVALLGNAPDPFNPTTSIRYQLREQAEVTLEVYDVAGRLVRTLVSAASVGPGRHEVVWNARVAAGGEIGSGVYFARLRAGAETRVDRMTLLR